MILEKLEELLKEINSQKDDNFEGIGLIVYNSIENLPISPINIETNEIGLPKKYSKDILDTLLRISVSDSDFHDGFHLISNEFALTHLSHYFSTPIIKNLNIKNHYGSRYRTALYGSFLPDVLFTAVLSKNYGPLVFKRGEIIEFNS